MTYRLDRGAAETHCNKHRDHKYGWLTGGTKEWRKIVSKNYKTKNKNQNVTENAKDIYQSNKYTKRGQQKYKILPNLKDDKTQKP